jgi:hypothetical protein
MNDSEFDDMLRSAGVPRVPLPASFRHRVWQRIEMESAGRSGFAGRVAEFFVMLSRPWVATGSLLGAMALGVWLGAVTAEEVDDGRTAYAESVSPFLHASR